MKYITLIIIIILSVGCTSLTNTHEPEEMADLASQLKDIAAAVDGTLKFSSDPLTDPKKLLITAIKGDKKRLDPFKNYQLKVITQDKNAVLLLCDQEVLLIEDAGCTAKSDLQHWQQSKVRACEVTIKTNLICDV